MSVGQRVGIIKANRLTVAKPREDLDLPAEAIEETLIREGGPMTTKKGLLRFEDYVMGIKNLRPEEQLRLIEIISARLKKNLKLEEKKHSVMELEGLGADIWENIDAQEYVYKERESWD